MNLIRRIRMLIGLTGCVVAAGLLLTACGTTKSTSTTSFGSPGDQTRGGETRLRTGDQLQVRIEAGNNPAQPSQLYEVGIDENGEVSLPLVGRVKAAGLSIGELTERIQANYVPRYSVRRHVIVLVTVPFFYVGGEVPHSHQHDDVA